MGKGRGKSMSLVNRMLLTFLAVTGLVLLLSTLTAMRYTLAAVEDQLDRTLLSSARTLAQDSRIIAILENKRQDQDVIDYLDFMIAASEDISVITVADMDSIRYFHPDKGRLGQTFVGGDQRRVVETGESYLSDAVGTLGLQRRAFAPVRSDSGQLGFVMVSAMKMNIDQTRQEIQAVFVTAGVLLMMVSVIAAVALAYNIKDSLLGNEPDQMTRNFLNREEVFASLEEGVLSVDKKGNIILVNRAAAEMLHTDPEALSGRQIFSVLPSLTVEDVLAEGKSFHNQPVGGNVILCDKLPIWERQKTIGAVVILRNRTEATRLAEQLTGSTHIINTLRAHTHEFMNQLHVIMGLLQMGLQEEAIDYIQDIARVQSQEVTPVLQRVRNPTVAALILGKLSHLREQRIELTLLAPRVLPKHSRFLSTRHQVTILGNLLENAMEAIAAKTDPNAPRQIHLAMEEGEEGLCVSVMDTGVGLAEPEAVFALGYSTKGPNRGIGMALVRDILDSRGGTITIDSEPGDGTCVTVIVDRPRGGLE